ncbi:MAG TPA: Clp protease N-terminal domain-containing protein [Galbitalea sp.]|jgi:D-alanyl-D-alanine carboxypeptidase
MAEDAPFQGMRNLVERSVAEARARGTTTVDAEHVLLALAEPGTAPGRALAAGGLTREVIVAALRTERLASLESAGAPQIDAQSLDASPRVSKPSWGASVVAARAREKKSGRRAPRRAPEIGVLIGILEAPLGTVPRALALAGIDRQALVDRIDLST